MGGNQTLLGKIVAVKRFSFVFFLPKLIYSLVPPVCFILKFLILLFPNSFLILFLIIILFIIHFLFYFLFNFWNCFIFLLKFKKYIHFIDIRKLMILLVVFQNFSHVVFQGMFDNTIASWTSRSRFSLGNGMVLDFFFTSLIILVLDFTLNPAFNCCRECSRNVTWVVGVFLQWQQTTLNCIFLVPLLFFLYVVFFNRVGFWWICQDPCTC